MSHQYQILAFDSSSAKVQEPMGTKTKYWVRFDTPAGASDWLFKMPRPRTGEHWAEKVAFELAKRIELPAARVELATLAIHGRNFKGTASQSFTSAQTELIHGNEMLARVVEQYDRQKRYAQEQHRVDAIFNAIERFGLASPPEAVGLDYSAAECFVGYLIFDGWIANVDRHHENWGMLAGKIDRLAPSYDHASSMGRLLTDDKRISILYGEHDRLDLEKFLTRSKAAGAIYAASNEARMPPWKLVGELARMGYRATVNEWLARIDTALGHGVEDVFSACPPDWISDPAREFASAILRCTYQLMTREMAL